MDKSKNRKVKVDENERKEPREETEKIETVYLSNCHCDDCGCHDGIEYFTILGKEKLDVMKKSCLAFSFS